MKLLATIFIALLLLLAGAYLLRPDSSEDVRSSLALSTAMAGDTTGYERAVKARPLRFPDDYGPHPGFKTEWWYYTGNLESDDEHRFGYELTIFRSALTPPDSVEDDRSSDWATNQLFMAHFSFADGAGSEFHAFERFSRGSAGLAGAVASPYRVWLEDWSIASEADEGTVFPTRLRASEDGIAIDLILETAKPIVLQGENGFDQKGPGQGNASYYYSFTRLPTRGSVSIDGRRYTVSGSSWKDHEWSTSALGDDQIGWDWFALQLSDGRDVMFYQLRNKDGSVSDYTNGTLVDADGSSHPISRDEVKIDVLDNWKSPHSDATYPSGWQLQIASEGLKLRITPVLRDQELNVSVRYWEGAVEIEGTAASEPISGWGYVELTGYGDEPTEASDYQSSRTTE